MYNRELTWQNIMDIDSSQKFMVSFYYQTTSAVPSFTCDPIVKTKLTWLVMRRLNPLMVMNLLKELS